MLPFRTYSVLVSVHDTAHQLRSTYRESVRRAMELAEQYHYTGTLLHLNLHQVDPWCLVPSLLEHTSSLVPLIATNPTAMPPHSLARLIAGSYELHGRKLALNVVTGAAPAERAAIGDTVEHDERYQRARDYFSVVRDLLAGERVTCGAPGWSYRDFVLDPALPPDALPEIFVAGSSPAGLETVAAVGQVAVTHATDPNDEDMARFLGAARAAGVAAGIRVGIVARATAEQAWRVVEERFPQERAAVLETMQKTRSESHWVRSLAERALTASDDRPAVWYGAFASAKSHATYLVGSYHEVAQLLGEYRRLGVTRLLLDGPYDEDEFAHHHEVFSTMQASDPMVVA